MALPGPSLYQKKTAARRRTSDITRLADQYQRNVQSMTSEYEQAFGQFQAQTKEKMAPYEAAISQYQTQDLPSYQQQADAYMKRLQAHQSALDQYSEYVSSFYLPVGSSSPQSFIQRSGKFFFAEDVGQGKDPTGFNQIGGLSGSEYQFVQTGSYENRYLVNSEVPFTVNRYEFRTGPDGRVETVVVPETTYVTVSSLARENLPQGYLKTQLPGGGFTSKSPGEFTVRTEPAKFTEPAPMAPEAPVAPEMPQFDSSAFDARRTQLQTEFERELGERRSARRRAVSRGGARPLLQGRA
jgi:hypothetical protein